MHGECLGSSPMAQQRLPWDRGQITVSPFSSCLSVCIHAHLFFYLSGFCHDRDNMNSPSHHEEALPPGGAMETQIRGPVSATKAGTTGTSPAPHLRPGPSQPEPTPKTRAMTA